MSGYNPFGLNALGSMSSLGSIAQSAQRLDRFNDMMSSSSRNQGSNWNRDKPRRSMDDDFFGGGGGIRRRSVSPPRHFDDDNRRRNQRHGNQRRNRGGDSFGASGGAGILGAAPVLNDNMAGPSLTGLGDLGGFGGGSGSFNEGGVSQLNNQAQQLINMMQTQQLLAAARANLINPKPPSLMQSGPNQGYSRQGGQNMNQRNSRNRNERSWHGRQREDRKRRMSPPRNPLPKRDRRDNNTRSRVDHGNKKTSAVQRKRDEKNKDEKNKDERTKKDAKSESKVTSKDVEEKEKKGEKKEESTAAQAKSDKKNAAGENVDELVKKNFDGTRYWCSLCKIVCLKSKNIYQHYFSKRHVKNVVESQGKVFDVAIMKEKKSEDQVGSIADCLNYVCDSRKIARKEKNDVIISSQHECTVKIKDFATRQNFMGSEFVKAISGFKCQLCKAFIRSGGDVKQHIQGKRHMNNYEVYLRDHPNYPDAQLEVNKNLVEILEKQEGKDVLLFEVKNNEVVDGAQAAEEPEKNCSLEENLDEDDVATYNMDEQRNDESKVDGDATDADEKEDSKLEESQSSTAPNNETEEELEKSLLSEDGLEQDDTKVDEVVPGEDEEDLLKSPTPKEEIWKASIPFLAEAATSTPVDSVKEEEVVQETKEQETKEQEQVEENKEEKEESTPSGTSFKEEVEEDTPTQGRRNIRKRGRGRGALTRGTRVKATRKSGRGAKNTKKTEEVEETNEEPAKESNEEPEKMATEEPENVKTDEPEEKEDGPEKKEDEPEKKEDEPEENKEKEETKEETKEEELPKEPVEDISFFDGFEVIDEIVGGDEEDDF